MKLTIFRSRNKHLELSAQSADNREMRQENRQTYKTHDGRLTRKKRVLVSLFGEARR